MYRRMRLGSVGGDVLTGYESGRGGGFVDGRPDPLNLVRAVDDCGDDGDVAADEKSLSP
jgi:hypothetical protein